MKKRKKYQYGDPVQDAINKGLIQRPVDEYAATEPYVSPRLLGDMTPRNTVKGPLPLDNATYRQPDEFAAYDFHPVFKWFNAAAQLTTGIANKVNDFKNTKDENQQYLKMMQGRPYENYSEEGLNNLPVYTKYGGGEFRIIEAEEGEVYQTPDGTLKKVNEGAGTHEEGGVLIKDAERILEDTSDKRKDKGSQLLKLTPEIAQNLTGYNIKKNVSHSKAMEIAKSHINKKTNKFEGKIKNNVQTLELSKNNPFANNSLNFNMLNLSAIPTEGQVFDNLFSHQETIKEIMGIENPKAQYGYNRPPRINNGKYVFDEATQKWYKAGTAPVAASQNDIVPYAGGKTPAGRKTPTGYDNAYNMEGGLDSFKDAWSGYVDLSKYKDAAGAQGAVYDYLSQNAPDVIDAMWKQYGNTTKGLQNNILTNKYANGDFTNATFTPEDRSALRNAYVDNMLGTRTMLPNSIEGLNTQIPFDESLVPPTATPPVASNPPIDNTRRFNFNQPKSGFNEPLRWYDIASSVAAISEGRIPARMNPVEYNQVRLKMQNPLPSLQAGQASYNAALQTLPSNSQGYANTANLFSKKYGIDNQVLGQYENINSGIKNQETLYNANVRDRQSAADQQSRELFEQKYLGSKEAQREQNLTGWDSLYTRIAQNRKLNREGNLLMKLFPAFDQYAEYNGYQPQFRMPNSIPSTGLMPPTGINTTGAQVIQKQEPQYYITIGGKQYPWKPPKGKK